MFPRARPQGEAGAAAPAPAVYDQGLVAAVKAFQARHGLEADGVMGPEVVALLDAPVRRVTGGEASPSISKVLERAAIAQKDEVIAELSEIARY